MKLLKNEGMATIEACALIPISLMLTIFLVWIGCYEYDLNVLSQAASMAALSGSRECGKSNEEIVEFVEGRMDELLKDKLVWMEDVNYDVTVSATKVTILVKASFEIPAVIFLSDVYDKDSWEIEIEKSAPKMNPSMLLRAAVIFKEMKESEKGALEKE